MSEELLDGGDRDAALGEDASEGVPELMAGEFDPGSGAVAIEQAADGGGGEGVAGAGEEDGGRVGARALAEPVSEGGEGEGRDEDGAFDIALADDGETRKEAGRWVEMKATESEASHFAQAQAAGKHEGEHGPIAGAVNDGEDLGDGGIGDIAGEAMRAADAVAAPDDGAGGRRGEGELEEAEERGERGETAGDGDGRVAEVQGVGDVGIDIARAEQSEGLVKPDVDEFEVVWVVPGSGGTGETAVKPGDVGNEFR